jgi:mono/diheme cytochrome c family protein
MRCCWNACCCCRKRGGQKAEQPRPDQSSSAAPTRATTKPPLTDQQRRGEALFVENCPLCHIPSKQKKMLGLLGPALQGVYGEDADEDSLRQILQQGFPGKMPGFRYDLDRKQMDDVIAFLKAGASTRIPSN